MIYKNENTFEVEKNDIRYDSADHLRVKISMGCRLV